MSDVIKVLCTNCQTELVPQSSGPGAVLECPKCHVADTRENICAELLITLQRQVDNYFGVASQSTKSEPRFRLVQS
ncbi:MAG: hypothetical protein WA792_17300 [Pseudolabrys sp.]